jgi:hypothetical protein
MVGSLAIAPCEHFDRDKARHEGGADQRLLAKRGSRKAETVVCKVRRRVRHDRRTAQGKNRCDYEMEELLHLYSPRAVDMPEDGFDDTDWSMADSIGCSRNEGTLKLAPGSRMSGKARQAVAADLHGIWAASSVARSLLRGSERGKGAL